MGAKVSSLVFRPPRATQMSEENYFYIDVDVVSPLRVPGVEGNGCGAGVACGSLDSGDLESLDPSLLIGDDSSRNVRDGVKYQIPAFFILRRNATQTILFSHGNAEDLGMMFDRMKELAKNLSVNIMAYDYTGYGLSLPMGEKPSENMLYRNIEAAYGYLTQVRKIPPSSIILYGRSLGGGPSCYLAAKTAMQGQTVGGLILHSAFLSVYKVVTDMNGLDMRLVGDMFHNEKRAKNIRCPTIIIHGRRDVVVPFWHAPRLLSVIPVEHRWKPMFVADLGHNSIESKRRDLYIHTLTNFINGVRIMKEMNAPIHPDFRASEEDVKDNINFYVNTMWLKHAKMAITDAFVGKSKPSASSKSSISSIGNSSENSSEIRKVDFNSELRKVDFSRGRTFDPSNTPPKTNAVANNRTRSFSGTYGQHSDARDEEDEFAPWREVREPSSRPTSPEPMPMSVRASTPPTRQETTLTRSLPSKQSTPRSQLSRQSTKKETTSTRWTPIKQSTRRSQSAIDNSEYDTKQHKLKDQYRKSNSMQLQAVSQSNRQRGGRNKTVDKMYVM
jgi:pimeloyl-ACP methyl ester carboxylesterase